MNDRNRGLQTQQTIRNNEDFPSDLPIVKNRLSGGDKEPKPDLTLKFSETTAEKRDFASVREARKSKFFTKEEFFESKAGLKSSSPRNNNAMNDYRDYEDYNEEEHNKAKAALQMIRKGMNRKEINRRDGFSPDKMGISSNARMPIDHQWILVHSAIEEEKKKELQEIRDKNRLKIENPNSMLHITHYTQNKQLMDYVKIEHEEDSSYLKMNVPDCQTFFRLQHELYEINRKKQDFEEMKAKIFDKKSEEELLHYDKQLKTVVAIQTQSAEDVIKMKGSKKYQKGVRLARQIFSPAQDRRKSMNPSRLNSIVKAINDRKWDAQLDKVEINEN